MQIENKIRNKIFFSLMLNMLLMIACFINIVFNFDTYKKVLNDDYLIINTTEDIYTKDKFVFADLTNAKLQTYSLENKEEKVNIYSVSIDDENILVLLKENTLLTKKTPVEIIDDNYVTEDIKSKIKDNDHYNKVLSNINYNLDRNIILYKIYIIFILICISLFSIIFDIFKIISPRNTKLYKRYTNY